MKCPKCEYIGYEETPRCRHCGYEFSLASPAAGSHSARATGESELHAGAAVVQELFGADHLEPTPSIDRLGFVGLHRLDGPPQASPFVADDLPLRTRPATGLFAEPAPPPARPPLAVRRAAADRPRSRTTTQVFRRPPASLLDSGAPEVSPPASTACAVSEPASVPLRFVAGAIDVALLGAIDLAVIYLTVRLAGLSMSELAFVPRAPLGVFLLGLGLSYLVVFTACGGQTLGKMAVGLRVVSPEGTVPAGRAMLRALMSVAGAALAGVGYVPALFSGQRQTLHDRLTDTRVVRVTG